MSYTYGSKHIDPLEDAVISLRTEQSKTRSDYWIVTMTAKCKGWTPAREPFAVKIEDAVEEIL